MNQRVSSIRNIRTIKALRGDALTIDLGRAYTGGTLTAWMKKDPDSATFRSFDIEPGNKLIKLPQDKTKDYFDGNSVLIEAIAGKWYFDVEFLADGAPATDSVTVVTGTIFFINDVTNSGGFEVTNPITGLTHTSQLINDGADGTSTYVEHDELSTVAISGNYTDLTNTPTKTSDFTNDGENGTSSYVEHIELADVATTGDYNDLNNQPTQTSSFTNNGADGTSTYVEHDELATVATSGSYTDLTNLPTIPTLFTDLTDTPGSYTGQGGKIVAVNLGETGLELIDAPTNGGEQDHFLSLVANKEATWGNKGETSLSIILVGAGANLFAPSTATAERTGWNSRQQTSTVAVGNAYGAYSNSRYCRFGSEWGYKGVAAWNNVNDSSFFMGVDPTIGPIGDVDIESLINIIGIGKDPSDTVLQLYHNDGAGLATKTSLNSDFTCGPANQNLKVELYSPALSSDVYWKVTQFAEGSFVDAVQSGVITDANVPATSTMLSPKAIGNRRSDVTGTILMQLNYLTVYV